MSGSGSGAAVNSSSSSRRASGAGERDEGGRPHIATSCICSVVLSYLAQSWLRVVRIAVMETLIRYVVTDILDMKVYTTYYANFVITQLDQHLIHIPYHDFYGPTLKWFTDNWHAFPAAALVILENVVWRLKALTYYDDGE